MKAASEAQTTQLDLTCQQIINKTLELYQSTNWIEVFVLLDHYLVRGAVDLAGKDGDETVCVVRDADQGHGALVVVAEVSLAHITEVSGSVTVTESVGRTAVLWLVQMPLHVPSPWESLQYSSYIIWPEAGCSWPCRRRDTCVSPCVCAGGAGDSRDAWTASRTRHKNICLLLLLLRWCSEPCSRNLKSSQL